MHMIFGKKQRAQRMARTDKQIQDILEPAEKRAALAKKEAGKLQQLIDEVKAGNNDISIKLYLAVNGREK